MSASNISYLIFVSQQITICLGIPIFIAGVLGNLLDAIVFLSLKTFRENSCAFYLTVMAIVNNGQLINGLFTRIMISGFNIDWTLTSTFYCKCRFYVVTVCSIISFTCMCLATIDQFFATCSNPRWQRWSNIKVARRVMIVVVIFWIVHGIPYWIYFDYIVSNTTGKITCMSSNDIFQFYHVKIYTAVYIGFLPIFINTLFGLLAYYNVKHLAYRTVPLVRRELDRQLTVIVLMHAFFVFLATIPYVIVTILYSDANIMSDPVVAERLQFTNTVTLCIYYLNFVVSDVKNIKNFSICMIIESILSERLCIWKISSATYVRHLQKIWRSMATENSSYKSS